MSDYVSDVLVVGGGLMGCATAYELVRSGLSVVIAEKNSAPGRETTARSGAIIRAHYGVPELVILALEANRRFTRFKEEVGADSGFTNSGYGVLVDEDDCNTLRAMIAMHKSLGVKVDLLDPSEFAALVPGLKVHDAALAAYEPEGGFAVPDKTIAAYSGRATDLGALFLYNSPIVAAEQSGTGWNVALGDGSTVSVGKVILTTGNWSRPVGALFGLELPVNPVRAQIVVVKNCNMTLGVPVVSDLINLAYFRAEGDGNMWVGSSDSADLQEALSAPEGYNETADPPAIASALKKSSLRFDGIDPDDPGGVSRSFCGLYEATPDWQPIIDSPTQSLHVAVGFSGHGFKLAPVIGEVMARRAAGLPDTHDVSIFNLKRFAEGKTIASRYPYRRARFLR